MSAMWLRRKRYRSGFEIDRWLDFLNTFRLMHSLRRPPWGCRSLHDEDFRVGVFLPGHLVGWLLTLGSRLQASEPLDFVYTLRGLLTKDIFTQIVPNFEIPLSQVFTQAARLAIREAGDLTVSRLHSMPLERCRQEGWPSWVPCWHIKGLLHSNPGRKVDRSRSGQARRVPSGEPFS